MDEERAQDATDNAKGAPKETDGKRKDDKRVQGGKEKGEAPDAVEEAERAAERAREERERSQF